MKTSRKINQLPGFTIVELSICLVVLGLIIGCITAGKSIIKQAQIKNLITEQSNYLNSINTFKTVYQAFPGDISNASYYWPNCTSPAANCNGNGNDRIEWSLGEGYRAWQHLALAGLVTGTYDGVSIEPISNYGSGSIWRLENNASQIYGMLANTSNSLELKLNSNANFLPSADAYIIDKKLDDAVPSYGLIYTLNNSSSDCVKQSDGITNLPCTNYSYTAFSTTSYNLGDTSASCYALYFYF
jgi:type II secretory pathway pseudopilin PulG